MSENSGKVLCVVPVRCGSKGIRHKAMVLVENEPLVVRTVRIARESGVFEQIVVSTDCPDVKSACRSRGIEVLDRSAQLSGDHVPVAEVVNHVAVRLGWHGAVACMQATCPMVKAETVRKLVEAFQWDLMRQQAHQGKRWGITVTPAPHIYWQRKELGAWPEIVTPRIGRQGLLDSKGLMLREVGALQIWSAEMVERAWVGWEMDPEVGCERVPLGLAGEEAVDVDEWADLGAVDRAVGGLKVHVEVAVGQSVGSGHLWRQLGVAEELKRLGHEVTFAWAHDWSGLPAWVLPLVENTGIKVVWGVKGGGIDADVVIFDKLDTTRGEVAQVIASGAKVVCFEDEGPGAELADLVVNELEAPHVIPQHGRGWLIGPRYASVRGEFHGHGRKKIEVNPTRVLVSFGGTDPAWLNRKVSSALHGYLGRVEVKVLLGPGANDVGCSGEIIRPGDGGMGMAEAMAWADVAFISRGRTMMEAAMMGVPTVTMAANERELRHVQVKGQLSLGLGVLMSHREVVQRAWDGLGERELREEMSRTGQREVDGLGLKRVVRAIETLGKGLE